mgnify:CR=1 FL=1
MGLKSALCLFFIKNFLKAIKLRLVKISCRIYKVTSLIKFLKSLNVPHRGFPGGPPSKYYPGPTMLNFSDLTRTGVAIVVWWYSERLVDFTPYNVTLQPT